MHEHHDEGLILDLIEMSASEAEAAARLDGCERCVADFAEQRSIAEYLGGLEPVTLTASERSSLHQAVFSELDAGATVVPMRSRRRLEWTRLGTVAAALVAVVAIGGVVSTIDGGDDEGADVFDQAATLTADDTDGAAGAAEAPADEERAEMALQDPGNDAAAIAAPSELVIDLGSVDVPTFESELDEVQNRVGVMTESSPVLQSDADEVSLSCLAELSDPGAVRAIVTAVVDGFEVEVYIDDSGDEYRYASIDCSEYELP